MCGVKVETELDVGHMWPLGKLVDLLRVLHGHCRDVFKMHGLLGSICLQL